MNPTFRVTVQGVLLCLLVCVHSRSLRSERWSTLDLPENREAFLSALQSYFNSKGIQIDRTAPAFVVLFTKTHDARNPAGYEGDSTRRERDFYESAKDGGQDEHY